MAAVVPGTIRCATCTLDKACTEYFTARRGLKPECKACSTAEAGRLLATTELRTCLGCGEARLPKAFYVDRGELTSRCKDCLKQQQKAYNATKGKAVRERYRSTAAREVAVVKYNKSKKAVAARARWRRRANESIEYRLIEAHRSMMCGAMRRFGNGQRKDDHTIELLGCSIAAFREHIERLWVVGMTWQNRGVGLDNWQIDHIRPLASFDLTKPEHQREAFHYSNQQPLWHSDNAKKSDKMPDGTRGRLLRCVIPRD